MGVSEEAEVGRDKDEQEHVKNISVELFRAWATVHAVVSNCALPVISRKVLEPNPLTLMT